MVPKKTFDKRTQNVQCPLGYSMGELELRLNISDSYPRLGLFLREKEQDGGAYVTGIYSFSNELVSLIKWMNRFYKIGSTVFKRRNHRQMWFLSIKPLHYDLNLIKIFTLILFVFLFNLLVPLYVYYFKILCFTTLHPIFSIW